MLRNFPVCRDNSNSTEGHQNETAFDDRICRLCFCINSDPICVGNARRNTGCSWRLRCSCHPSQRRPRSWSRPYGSGRSRSSLRMGQRPRTSSWLAPPSPSLVISCVILLRPPQLAASFISQCVPNRKLRAAVEDRGMVEYRAYTVDRDGHFLGFEPLVCANDAEAIEQAKRLIVNNALSFGAANAW